MNDTKETLAQLATAALEGVGDPGAEWHEWTGRAYHIRRLLTKDEQQEIGPAVDCRGTDEWARRYYPIAYRLPAIAQQIAWEERQ